MGGKTTINAPKPDYTPMLKVLESMRQEQALAAQQSAQAQERALAESQDTAAQAGMNQANTAAMQDLMRQQQYQQALDAAAKQQQQAQGSAMGHDITGPAFDVNAATQQRMSGLSAIAPTYTPTPANLAAFDFLNPSQKSTPTNKFTLPNQSNLKLGGY